MPYVNRTLDCGSYFIDLTEKNTFEVGRSVFDLPVGNSCTYRAWSTCGYPQVSWRVNDPKIVEDFDIAWATMDGLLPSDELNRWEFKEMTDYRGSFASNLTLEFTTIKSPNVTEKITAEQWNSCKGPVRNLWISFTRVKDSDPPKTLAREARQLDFYPNGTKFADIDIVFSNFGGPSSAASFIKVVSVAFAAGLAALAF
jgi:hypothetical protein